MNDALVRAKQLMHESVVDFYTTLAKGAVGFAGSITAATINTWIGILAGLMTCIYMAFQIEAAWRNRKAAILRKEAAVKEQE